MALSYSFPSFEPVDCFMSGSKCCFLTCIQLFQETGKVVWYSHLFKDFPQFFVIHTLKGVSMVNEADVDVFLELLAFSSEPMFVGKLISCSSAFSKLCLYIWKVSVHIPLTMLKNVQTTIELCSFHILVTLSSKSFQVRLQRYINWEIATDITLLGSKTTADGDCSHEIKRCSLEEKLWQT